MATNKQRYTVSVDDEMFKQIEDFRFEHRFATRSEATVELIKFGLNIVNTDLKVEDSIDLKRKK